MTNREEALEQLKARRPCITEDGIDFPWFTETHVAYWNHHLDILEKYNITYIVYTDEDSGIDYLNCEYGEYAPFSLGTSINLYDNTLEVAVRWTIDRLGERLFIEGKLTDPIFKNDLGLVRLTKAQWDNIGWWTSYQSDPAFGDRPTVIKGEAFVEAMNSLSKTDVEELARAQVERLWHLSKQ